MKTCSGCGKTKPLAEFHKNRSSPDGRRSVCKECQNKKTKKWAQEHPERMRELQARWRESHKEHTAEYFRVLREDRGAYLNAIKRRTGCVDCGTTEGQLHFDHRPGTVKLFNVSDGMTGSWSRLLAEIAKCDIRCNGCHGKRHAAAKSKTQPDPT